MFDFLTKYFFSWNIDLNVGTRRAWSVFHGESPWFFIFSYKACKLSSRYSFGGGARDRPLAHPVDFHGSLNIECLEEKKIQTHR